MRASIFYFLFLLTTLPTVVAQSSTLLEYRQNKQPFLKVRERSALEMGYHWTQQPSEALRVHWSAKGSEIVLSTPDNKLDSNLLFSKATFSMPLFDAAIEGHLAWGKAVLEALDSQARDSVVIVATYTQLPNDSILSGPLALSFVGGWQPSDEFWNRAAQYKLLDQQRWVDDSVRLWKREVARAKALFNLSHRALEQNSAEQATLKKALSESCADTLLLDSLLRTEAALDQGLEKARHGQAITNPEKMRLAEQTTTRSQLQQRITSNSLPTCQQQLTDLLNKQRQRASLERQQKLLAASVARQQRQFQTFVDLQKRTAQQLKTIVARLSS